MDILKQYLNRADDIISERTADEKKYDIEVIRWLRTGESITMAIGKATEKYPSEALQITDDTLPDIQAHYEYLAEHEAIVQKLTALKK